VLSAWRSTRAQNIYAPFTAEAIQKALASGSQLSPVLKEQLDWSKAVASVITDGLKGNPRQVKRMLNAMSLRKELAAIAKISVKEEILAKLMVLGYSNLPLFQELNQWQTAEKGVPSKLKTLESEAMKEEEGDSAPADDGLCKMADPVDVVVVAYATAFVGFRSPGLFLAGSRQDGFDPRGRDDDSAKCSASLAKAAFRQRGREVAGFEAGARPFGF
jgi:hypothetical protein